MTGADGIWAVVIFKGFRNAKQRLSTRHGAVFRRRLSAAMLKDVFDAVEAASSLAGVVLVTPDRIAAREARRRDFRVLAEPAAVGINHAVAAAAELLTIEGRAGMLVLPADVPGVRAADIDRMLELHETRRGVSLVPSHDLAGTNALLLSPPDVIAPCFGEGSFTRHVAEARSAGIKPTVVALPGVALDIDHPEDCEAFLKRGQKCRSHAFLSLHEDVPSRDSPDRRFGHG